MALYEIVTRELYSRKKIPAVRLRELEPVTHAVLNDHVVLPDGTKLTDGHGKVYRTRSMGALTLLGNGYGTRMPAGDYLTSTLGQVTDY